MIEYIDTGVSQQVIRNTKDCLSCAQSMSADDEDGNMILICVKDGIDVPVQDSGYCKEWKD